MKTFKLAALLLGSVLLAAPAAADERITVTVTNLTHGIYFTPLLVAAHDRNTHLFGAGEAASSQLQAMAEGGDIGPLAMLAKHAGAVVAENPAAGLLAPGAVAAAHLEAHQKRHGYLSVVAMMLPTNDGFVGIDAWPIPHQKGTYVVDVLGWDAGTEANDERITGGGAPGVPGIPGAPGGHGGSGGTGVASVAEGYVHVHRGVLGDTDPTGGMSDVDSRFHRWNNPVARVTITVR